MCRKLLVLLAFACAVLATSNPASAADVNGAWALEVQPTHDTDPTAKRFREEVLFLEGTFSAAASAMYGFAPATYTLENGAFNIALTSNAHGTQVWTGTRSGQVLNGTLVWTKPDGRVLRYTFTGEPALTVADVADPDD